MAIIETTPTKNDNFYNLRQKGLLGIRTEVTFGQGSIPLATFTESNPTRSDLGKVRHVYDQVRGLLGISSFAEVPLLLTDRDKKQKARMNAYDLIGNMYGIQTKPEHNESDKERKARIERIKEQVEDYAIVANDVVEHLNDVLSSSPVNLETINVVKDTYDPVDLILIGLDNRYGQRVRFEAKRKLILMNLAAKIDQREREIHINKRYRKMNEFLDTHVFKGGKIGEARNIALVSTHDTETFATTAVTETLPQKVMEIELHPGEKITPLLQRSFTFKGEEIPVQIDTRKKSSVSKVLKMLRKGKENPSEAIGDDVGFMAIFRNRRDIGLFKKHLNACGLQAGTLLDIQDVENTLDGSAHEPQSAGSSSKLRQDKSHIMLSGITIEGILHTYDSYTDYLYQREVGHDEFDASRYFDSGVVGLLFPTDIYPYDEDLLKSSTVKNIRSKIENS
ncbi:MAG TPA: hypothetical protein VNW29_02545 [Candidatus Sulfotelmatobacter sp.]|jgi:hypothetical protein|nr:hypothetical protein [Candidatus Sulfotelmatobacter sp.]